MDSFLRSILKNCDKQEDYHNNITNITRFRFNMSLDLLCLCLCLYIFIFGIFLTLCAYSIENIYQNLSRATMRRIVYVRLTFFFFLAEYASKNFATVHASWACRSKVEYFRDPVDPSRDDFFHTSQFRNSGHQKLLSRETCDWKICSKSQKSDFQSIQSLQFFMLRLEDRVELTIDFTPQHFSFFFFCESL
jgi:hypothetical protein